jgi:TetR/AcrR family transcriptional regulator of autoinduction and epiphytic fitness
MQARETRRAILEAAGRLFVDPGYAATPIAAIAQTAEVSVQTIYAVFGSKRQLLSALVDVTIAGDDEPVPMAQRAFVDRIRSTSDPREKLARYADHLVETHQRQAAVMLALTAAASADPDVAAIWRKNRDEARIGMTMFAHDLASTGALRPDLDLDAVVDVLCLAMDVRNYDWLVRQRQWSDERFQEWYVATVAGAILT